MDKVIEVEALRLDEWGDQTKIRAIGNKFRISIYFDYKNDNHHIQFLEGADRKTVGDLLHNLADSVLYYKE